MIFTIIRNRNEARKESNMNTEGVRADASVLPVPEVFAQTAHFLKLQNFFI